MSLEINTTAAKDEASSGPASPSPRTLTAQLALWKCASQLSESEFCFAKHPYFQWMRAEATTRADFMLSQRGFVFAVDEWSCSIAQVLAKIPRCELRMRLLRNLMEEHGHGVFANAHKSTFTEFLVALGASEDDCSLAHAPLAVRAFNESVRNFCAAHTYAEGAALLGMIEFLYISISTAIADHVHSAGWVAPGSQRHYAMHMELDIGHAADLFALAEQGSGLALDEAAEIMRLAGYWFWSLYSGLMMS